MISLTTKKLKKKKIVGCCPPYWPVPWFGISSSLATYHIRFHFAKFHWDLIVIEIQCNKTFDRNLLVKRWSIPLSAVDSTNDRVLLPSSENKTARIYAVTSFFHSTTKTEHLCVEITFSKHEKRTRKKPKNNSHDAMTICGFLSSFYFWKKVCVYSFFSFLFIWISFFSSHFAL